MPYDFYTDPNYKIKQSIIAKNNWRSGNYKNLIKWETRICKNESCINSFTVKPGDKRVFCSHSCSAHVGNLGRIQPVLTRQRISKSLLASPYHLVSKRVERIILTCKSCGKTFSVLPYLSKRQKFCSIHCSISNTGKLTTSPKASKGKNGIRPDIDPNINFYSTWEANIARVYNFIGLRWTYSPRIFDLGLHTYRPDFYLPDFDTYIEVKNFMGDYSKMRDSLFREKFPNIKLELILKNDYLEIKSIYKHLVQNWEY